ncbi:uncharacterized protein LOC101864660 [Aplysia californica]|uniref:RNA-binding protein 48 n=1 Tax=Aplysia californica TaxID=6500 RepID=A0ABM0JB69_APLCA|nr:uncharacterized protein LOC101864660 [Aplysia californica]
MTDDSNVMASSDPEVPSHHVKQEVCATRKPYREGRHAKAVKVYTVNNESRYILIQGVPCVGATKNLVDLCSKFGAVEEHHALDEYPCEDKYTEVYLFKYKKIQSARFAKRKLDDYSFFGGALHVCYAPEYETVSETREKLLDRRRVVAYKIRQHEAEQKMSKQATPSTNAREVATPTPVADSNVTTSGLDNGNMRHNQPAQTSTPLTLASHASRVPLPQTFPPSHGNVNPAVPTHTHFSAPITAHSQRGQVLASEPTFELPLPPQASSFIPHSVRGRKTYEFSRVPSAHATLPSGFDGRLNTKIDTGNTTILPKMADPPSAPISSSTSMSSSTGVKIAKGKLDSTTVIVKKYKPQGPAPKFVPRQAVKRKATDTSELPQRKKTDGLDHEIRQNAFQLGQLQGPENLEKSTKNPVVPPALNKSVTETIHAIRSKISQVINASVKKQT